MVCVITCEKNRSDYFWPNFVQVLRFDPISQVHGVLYGVERSRSFCTSSSWWARFRLLTWVSLNAFVNAWLTLLRSHLISKFGLSFIKITNICWSMPAERGHVSEHHGHLNGSFDLVTRFIILFAFFLSWFSLFFSALVCWLTMLPEHADWVYKSVTWSEEASYTLADLGTWTIAL